MVKKCCVFGCRSESFKDCGITFFKVPKSDPLRQLWIDAIPGKVMTYSVVCHLHFQQDDIMALSSRPKLRLEAIPSIFPNLKTLKKTPKVPNTVTLKSVDSIKGQVTPSTTVLPTKTMKNADEIEDEEGVVLIIVKENIPKVSSTSDNPSADISLSGVNDDDIKNLRCHLKILQQRSKMRNNRIKDLKSKCELKNFQK